MNFTETGISYKGANAIFSGCMKFGTLQELTVNKNNLDGTKLRVLRDLMSINKGLKVLNMEECHMGEEGALFLSQGLLKNHSLEVLNLSNNNFGDDGAKHFAIGMQGGVGFQLKTFDLSRNFITDKGGL